MKFNIEIDLPHPDEFTLDAAIFDLPQETSYGDPNEGSVDFESLEGGNPTDLPDEAIAYSYKITPSPGHINQLRTPIKES